MTEQFQSTSTDTSRSKARTSAAMLGLAISVGATGLLLPRQGDSARAAAPPVATTKHQPETVSRSHVVQPGETLDQIASSYSTNLDTLLEVNEVEDAQRLQVGQTLQIPAKPGKDDWNAIAAESYEDEAALASKPTSPEKANAKPSISLLDGKGVLNGERPINTLTVDATPRAASVPSLPKPVVVRPEDQQAIPVIDASKGQEVAALEVAGAADTPQEAVLPVTLPVNEAKDEALVAMQKVALVGVQRSDLGLSLAPELDGESSLDETDILAMAEPSAIQAGRSYQVQAGDTLGQVAQRYGTSLRALVQANGLDNPHMIRAGQVLVVPPVMGADLAVYAANGAGAAVASAEAAPVAGPAVPQLPRVEATASPAARVSPVPRDGTSGVRTTQNAYIAGLQAEIRALQQKYEGRLSTVLRDGPAVLETEAEARDVVTVDGDETQSDAAALSEESSPALVGALPPLHQPTDAEAAVSEPRRVALASPGLDDRNPAVRSLLGQTVSPSLPPLASADAYLPGSMSFNGYIWPTKGVFTSGYGWRWGRMHKGIDIAAPIGTPIVAAADGEVAFAGWNSGGYGKLVDIRHADGSLTRYAHNSRVLVKRGQKVRQGQLISEMGSTGRSTGPHLHFEIRRPGKGAINPKAMLPQGGLRAAR